MTWGGRWYLVAWDLDGEGGRTFRADRISPRIPGGPRFNPRQLPGNDIAAFVDGGELGDWASMAASRGYVGGGWLSAVWGGSGQGG